MSGTRVPLALLAAAAMVIAGWGGLARLGLLPSPPGDITTQHGALIVSGFTGTLIGLERSIAVQRGWAVIAPAFSALAGVALLAGLPASAAAGLVVVAGLAFLAVTVTGAPASPRLAIVVMSAGALAWIAGAVVWLVGEPSFRVMPFLLAFLVLTIAAERMELARALRPAGAATLLLLAAAAVFALGIVLSLVDLTLGLRVAGAGALVLALWLALRDRPPAAAPRRGLPRFIASAITLAYGWLAIGALALLTFDGAPAGWRYDAMVHALFVGFVFTMIFAHGPIVIPSVIGGMIHYRPIVYVPLVLLAGSLAVRIAGDMVERASLRDAGAIGIALAVVAFAAAIGASLRGRRGAARAAR